MSDSPIHSAPVSAPEKPILDKLLLVRDRLLLLKQDKSTYVKSQDVLPSYEEVIELVHQLNDVRGEDHLVQNRVDSVLDDCFQLISLFFMAIGRNNEAPAIFSMTGNITRLLDHLGEARFYSTKDLEHMEGTVAKMARTLEAGKDKYSPYLLTRIQYRLEVCEKQLKQRREFLSSLDEDSLPIWENLVSLVRAIAALNTRSQFSTKDLNELRGQLLDVKATMKDGKIPSPEGRIGKGQELLVAILERCLHFCDLAEARKGKVEPRFLDTYEKLIEIRNHLERLTMTQAWSLRETDLYMWQRKLDRIDDGRRDGNFFDAEGHPADLHAQRTMLYLIRRGYAYIYQLLVSSEPVSEALLPIYKQLTTLRTCLIQVQQSGGVSSARELYPYSMKLSSIDNMRVDGKFMVGKDIPEGQGSVSALLAECYDIAYELRAQAETAEQDAEKEESAPVHQHAQAQDTQT